MYPPRIEALANDLVGIYACTPVAEGTVPLTPLKYDHHKLPEIICNLCSVPRGLPEYKGLTSRMMCAGSYLGLNPNQIRALFLPHTVKKPWEEITVEEVVQVLHNLAITERVEWHTVTETHMKLGSLAASNKVHDPKYLAQLAGVDDEH